MSEAIISKNCRKCSEHKPIELFPRSKGSKDGHKNQCKKCQGIATAAWAKENPERYKALHAANYRKNAQKISEKAAADHAANPEKQRARNAAKYAANPEKAKAYNADWARRNREARSAHARNRRAIARQADGSHTASDVLELLSMQKCMCVVCRAKIKNGYHVDHIIPLSKGGGNGKANLQLLCPTCNMQKHAKHPVDFMQSRGFLL